MISLYRSKITNKFRIEKDDGRYVVFNNLAESKTNILQFATLGLSAKDLSLQYEHLGDFKNIKELIQKTKAKFPEEYI